jgi:PAS domain S-box-containing protein
MSSKDNEEELLRSVALQNARAILLARERAETSLWQAKKELERKNEDLFQQREWFKVTLSSIGDGVITTDSEGVLTFLNPVAEVLTGWSATEAVGLPLAKVFVISNEQTGERLQNPVAEALRDGTVVSLANHTILTRRDGTRVPIEDSAAPIRDSAGRISGAVMVFHDVTDRRQRDEVLWRLAAVIESSDDAILSMSLDAVITTWNAGAERMYGYTAEEVIGKSVTILIPPDRTDEEPEILERLKKGERIDHYETVRRTKGGTDLHVSLTVSPIKDSAGNMIGVSKISRDITRRKRDEQALREQAINNAGLYDEAQRELAERKRAEEALRQAQEKLSRYAEDLEEQVAERTTALLEKIADLEAFSYSVSHDLRAPLRAVQSYALILAEECASKVNGQEREYLRRMVSAAERMDRLIQDVLSFSRMSRMEVALQPIDLGKLLRGIVESYPLFQAPSAIVELKGPFPAVLGSDALLTQCVSNILANAVKFVAPGVRPEVQVWARTAPEGEKLKLFFRDNGLGIPVEAHQKIFGIFERISNDYEGTGIGLCIVKKAVDLMRGTVGLESAPGQGSTFWLELNCPKQRNI